ncbi:chromosome segregation protein SMC [Streptococcus anginosus]|uniref:Chromosome partition protein Smc n=1 Tax=Streptococcus anginosus subsp. whileyi CCUG 39159 TaxID=1095729 RepID=I0SHW5_STRAP|nr:chromosome segregation protein SMC [Streptococcus anginosus]EID22968.1 chromosome segregation protein SMC [Streptococcus anginosus subsp. whileyi CCUG 39159]MDB8660987.1 chromosome segregation protein SMC [Streptococcus anginosus]QQT09444.1 chromosome segregation protein SMC [Streptococcus anginosus]BAN61978.1 chromosome segregation ATPases [Streptococcus anginosus subsp. whileyi MAS624]
MYLKEIEIQGFKSFADKTKVIFDQGVTAVVGPNGSGKSNITESLRWALGESSVKSLRGGKMPDVIFAGTETRKPLNYASVVVVLDNKDRFIQQAADEIRVERHIYRSGDSEYKIDGKKVRLRDIHDLFMDTGLGRDSFSIISQGKVEEIFNSKPEERRAIFEEAAGVLKYKTRRKETESKLSQTQDNLDRLEDIIYELDSQVKPLEKQATTAKQFLKLDEERRALYLDVLIAQIKENKTQLNDTEERLVGIQQSLSAYYSKRDQLEQENALLKEKRHDLQKQMADDQASLLELTRLISDLERQIEVSKLESSQAANSRKENEERLKGLTEKLEAVQTEWQGKDEQLTDFAVKLEQNQQAIHKLEAEIEAFSDDPDQMIEKLRAEFVQLMQEEADLSNDLTALESRLANELQLSESKQAEFAKLKENLKNLQINEQSQLEDLATARQLVQQLLADYQAQLKQVQTVKTNYQQNQTAMFDLMDDVKNKKARVGSLEAILKNHSHFYAGVKSVLQEAERLGGIIGAVSEKLSFDSHYQTALEIALGASSQHIIVEDEQAATRAIEFLKRNRTGRATFLPLTTIKARHLPDHHQASIEKSTGFLGLASSLVHYDKSLEHIFQNLLGTTAIFDTVENARAAARKVRYQVRIVTLDGTELRTGGSYAGGANRSNNTIFIKPELDALQMELSEKNATLAEQEKQVEDLHTHLSQANSLLEEIKVSGEEARLAEQKAQMAYEQTHKQVEDLSELLVLQERELSREVLPDMAEQKEKLVNRLAEIEQEKTETEAEIEQIKSDKDAVQARLDKLTARLSELRLARTELTGHQRYVQTDLTRLSNEKSELDKEISTLQFLMEQKEETASKVDIAVLEEQLTQAEQEKTALNQANIRCQFELDDLEGQTEDITSHLEQVRHQNEDLIRKQAKTEAEKDKVADVLRRLLTNLTDDYQMSVDEASKQARPLENLAVSETKVKDLEKTIRALGPVNLDAVEQFEEVSQRLHFLNTQRDDVLSAKNLLLETIEEMNDEVKERFKSTFEAIRESFKVTFRQMFGGGSADLILTEGDLLTAGVEISVQPPGKKIQSLNLMSGGEKALSALALLFSIIRVKTIPFVILDEVEAALDEANVKRFGDYLNRFDKDSQFIVVTHRKGTMSAADSIYGVTMQESGVSKIVSVKLKDLESM